MQNILQDNGGRMASLVVDFLKHWRCKMYKSENAQHREKNEADDDDDGNVEMVER